MSVRVRPYRGGGLEVDIVVRTATATTIRERRRVTITSKAAAQRWGEQRERELLLHGPAIKQKEVPTVVEFVPRFIEGHAVANRHKPGGIDHKQTVLRVHIVPALGGKRLDAITNEDVQRLKHGLREKKPRTVNDVLTVLNTMLAKAMEWGVIDHRPCTVKLLKVGQGALDFHSFEEYEALVVAAAAMDARIHLLILLGGDAGLRAGEMRALEWADINFATKKVTVARSDL